MAEPAPPLPADVYPSSGTQHGLALADHMDMHALAARAVQVEAGAGAGAEAGSAAGLSAAPPAAAAAPDLPQPGHGPPPPPAYRRRLQGSVLTVGRAAVPSSLAASSSSGVATGGAIGVSAGVGVGVGAGLSVAGPSAPSQAQQLAILREAYARNPHPDRRALEALAAQTGRPWGKIREYFRQRRNKLRGLGDVEGMVEPGRAASWLQVAYRASPEHAVAQLALYTAYKARFDPYAAHSPLLGGHDLIQLALATFPGAEMARDETDYVVRGVGAKDGDGNGDGDDDGGWEQGVEGLVEPLRGAAWLLSTYQHPPESVSASVGQADLYTSYAARFSLLPTAEDMQAPGSAGHGTDGADGTDHVSADATAGSDGTGAAEHGTGPTDAELHGFEHTMAGTEMDDINALIPPGSLAGGGGLDDAAAAAHADGLDADVFDERHAHAHEHHVAGPPPPPPRREHRLLDPVELISLVRMTFPKCEPAVDAHGRFVIRGLERRDAVEKGRHARAAADMFPFALMNAPSPSDPAHPLTSLLKRKLARLAPDAGPAKRARADADARANSVAGGGAGDGDGDGNGAGGPPDELAPEDEELLEGIRRFRHSKLGREVRDACVNQ
ncbi:hypothetical protein Q5752_002550 [Cryptotrichosporon argae]